jgi:hypothetical protein
MSEKQSGSVNKSQPAKSLEDNNLSFEKKEYKENIQMYIFDNVAVAIDTTGKNYKELPEIYFGTYDKDLTKGSFHQPEIKREGVDMEYVAKCIKEIASDSGIHEFWFYPLGDDVSIENKDTREQARLRLFQRLGNISAAPGGYGYVLKV